ncbi:MULTISPECIES: hypothetical protein [Flavobacterium]|uniref:Uncharacterized protein n=1 Tax=Flavobacterium ginsengisoli TaxID=871694 RepID=A0ABP7FCE6_9FLAO|nr:MULTISPECIES: hypothetical protein [Flavobacterium]MBJ2126556.1 hypothetical protein [Flavobacterium sp. IB48]
MNKIILNDNFEFKQKAILLVPTFFFLYFSCVGLQTLINHKIKDLNVAFFIMLFVFSMIGISLLVLTFSKVGFKVQDNELYRILSFLDFNFYSKKINAKGNKIFSILYKKAFQRNEYLSAGGADVSYNFAVQDFVFLNENHLEKESIVKLNSQKHSEELKLFLEESGKLKFEIYSPNFK